MRKLAVIALVALPLGACLSPAQIRERETQACQGYGFTPGTPEFSQCLMTVDQERLNRRAAAAASSKTCTYGNGIMNCY